MAAKVIFDPRVIALDGETQRHEEILWHTKRARRAQRSKYAPSQDHLDALGKAKAEVYILRNQCLDCGLVLVAWTSAKRCVTCQARHKIKAQRELRQERRRVNAAFVGHSAGYPRQTAEVVP